MRTGGYHIFQTIMYMWGWVKTYYTIFWGIERPFTTYFNVHQGTWVLISSHIRVTNLWDDMLGACQGSGWENLMGKFDGTWMECGVPRG